MADHVQQVGCSTAAREAYLAGEYDRLHPKTGLPIGTLVKAYPGTRDSEPLVTRTRSEVWRTGAGDAVVAVEGYAGGIALTHIDVIVSEVSR